MGRWAETHLGLRLGGVVALQHFADFVEQEIEELVRVLMHERAKQLVVLAWDPSPNPQKLSEFVGVC